MPMKVKWDFSGKGEEAWGSEFKTYEGETPPKGSYIAKIKRMTIGKIKSQGDNHGKPRISVLLELVGGAGSNGLSDPDFKYLGAPIWDGLNMIQSQAGRVNGFLHALTDGSQPAKDAVELAYWPPNGPKADRVKRRDGTEEIHITDIGKYHIGSPDGNQLVRIITKMGRNLDGSPRAEVSQYLPYTGPKPGPSNNGADVVEDDDEEDDLLDQYEDEPEEDLVDAEEPPF